VSTYNLVLSVALRTYLYGALKELMSPAVLTIIIVMYYRLWWAGLFIQPYSVRRHMVYIGWRTYTFSFEFLSLQVEVVSCHSWLHPYWYVCRCRCTRNVRSTSLYVLYLGVLRVERRTVRRDRHYVAMDRGEIGVCVRRSMYCSSTISLEDVMKRTGSVCLYGYT
jgi:hypothetical protein